VTGEGEGEEGDDGLFDCWFPSSKTRLQEEYSMDQQNHSDRQQNQQNEFDGDDDGGKEEEEEEIGVAGRSFSHHEFESEYEFEGPGLSKALQRSNAKRSSDKKHQHEISAKENRKIRKREKEREEREEEINNKNKNKIKRMEKIKRIKVMTEIIGTIMITVFVLYALRTSLRSADWKSEETLFVSAMEIYFEHFQSVHGMGLLRYKEGSFEASKQWLQLNILSNHTESLWTLGKIAVQEGQFQSAIDFFTRSLKLNTLHKSNNELGLVYWRLGQPDFAEKYIIRALHSRSALSSYSSRKTILNNVGCILILQRHQPQEALKYLLQAVQLDEREHLFHINLANCFAELLQFSNALLHYQTAFRLMQSVSIEIPSNLRLRVEKIIELKDGLTPLDTLNIRDILPSSCTFQFRQ